MPTSFELTWQEDNNRVPTQDTLAHQQAYQAYYMKALPMGQVTLTDASGNPIGSPSGLWTCYYSCNGTTAGTAGDGVDRWGSSFTPANIVTNNPGSAHSWFVAFNSTLGIYMCLDCCNGGGFGANFMTVVLSKTAFSGGSTTARPTSTGEFGGSNSFNNTLTALEFNTGTLQSHHVHGRIETGGQFMIMFSRDGQGHANFALEVRKLAEARSGEAHNAWLYTEYDDTNGVYRRLGAASNANAGAITSGNGIMGWVGRKHDASAVVMGVIPFAQVQNLGAINLDILAADATDGLVGDDLIRLYACTTGSKSKRGRVQDAWWTHDAVTPATTEPTTGPPFVRAVVGNRWIPWHSTVGPSF